MRMVINIMVTMHNYAGCAWYHNVTYTGIHLQGSGNVECVFHPTTRVQRAGGWSVTDVPASFMQSV